MGELAATAKIAFGLAGNGLRYRYLRLAGRPGRPQAVSLEVTHRCVCRCVMCNIWKIPASVPDLSLEQWNGLLSSPLLADLRELDITGGEPFLRDDLVSLVGEVCRLKAGALGRLRSIAITTNGVLCDRVVDMVEEMLVPMERAGLDLVVVCALDAVGESHDRIRQYPGAWSKVDRCVEGLTRLRDTHPHLVVGVKTTVLPQNVGQVGAIADYARRRGLFTIISPAIVTGGRYLNTDRAGEIGLNEEQRATLAEFYESPACGWSYHAGVLSRYLRTGDVTKPCTCGYNYLFVRSSGEVLLCPLLPDTVGNVCETPLETLFSSSEARRTRRRIGRTAECRRCTEPGLERYALPYEGFSYLRTLMGHGPRSFLRLHQHMGLDKYV
jgi:MoaA/NifB/PqqE/SkfB family radical SAM enzyme